MEGACEKSSTLPRTAEYVCVSMVYVYFVVQYANLTINVKSCVSLRFVYECKFEYHETFYIQIFLSLTSCTSEKTWRLNGCTYFDMYTVYLKKKLFRLL